MKIRIFKGLRRGVFHVRIQTEDWSERDRDLMRKYGEPEINLGGEFFANGTVKSESSASAASAASSGSSESSCDPVEPVSFTVPDSYARIMTESPFVHRFDSRDIGNSIQNAKAVAQQWASLVEDRLVEKTTELRSLEDSFTTEEITEI